MSLEGEKKKMRLTDIELTAGIAWPPLELKLKWGRI